MTTVADLKGQTVAFAASGGLDSCTVTKWLTENGVKVVCFTADIAQPDETNFGEIETRMRACGAADYVAIPLHDMIAEPRRRGHPVSGPLRGRVLEHDRHRPARHRRRA